MVIKNKKNTVAFHYSFLINLRHRPLLDLTYYIQYSSGMRVIKYDNVF